MHSTTSAARKRGGRLAVIPARAIDDRRLMPAAFRVLATLGTYADRDGWCHLYLRTVAERLDLSASTVSGHLHDLARLGYLEIHAQQHDDHAGLRNNRYRLLYDAALPGEAAPAPSSEDPKTPSDSPKTASGQPNLTLALPPEQPRRGLADEVYEFWRTERGKNANTKLTDARRRAIKTALKAGYTREDLLDAIRGVARDPWRDRANHDDLTVILRLNGSQNNLEKFRDLWRGANRPARKRPPVTADPSRRIVPDEEPLPARLRRRDA